MQALLRGFKMIDFRLSSKDVLEITKKAITDARADLDNLGQKSSSPLETIKQLALSEARLQTSTAAALFLRNVAVDAKVRQASVEANDLFDAFTIEKGMREDVLRLFSAMKEDNFLGEDLQFYKKVMLGFKQNGLGLDPEQRATLRAKRERLSLLSSEYLKNLSDDNSHVLFTREELEGCPEEFLGSLDKAVEGGERLVVTTKTPDVTCVKQYARREETRRAIEVAFNSRARMNSALLEEAIRLRFECAQLLGYPTHAHFRLDDRLAKTPEAVIQFEEGLRQKLTPLAQEELTRLKAIKLAETGSDSFRTWDYQYYSRILRQRDYGVDQEVLKTYFNLENVIDEMLRIYEEVLCLRFEVKGNNPDLWHPDAKTVLVFDGATGHAMGTFFLDLYPREGKYGHAACFQLVPGCELSDGSRQLPVSAIVANFTKPTKDLPSLLNHEEVVTLFHELGHAMHDMCARTKYSRFHGTNVETDFVEAPSQMLEEWCWNMATLKRLSKHYIDGNPLPEDLIDGLVRTKTFNAGLNNLRQVYLGLFDLTIHSIQSGVDGLPNGETVEQLYERLRAEIGLIRQPQGVCPAASFEHVMDYYDAGYYGYLWSEVFSSDMFHSRFLTGRDGQINSEVGRQYRKEILEPGASRDGMDSLRAFLGRDPNPDAFVQRLFDN